MELYAVHEIGFAETSQENVARVRLDKVQTCQCLKDLEEGNRIHRIFKVKNGI